MPLTDPFFFATCDCSHVIASSQSGRSHAVSCNVSAASLEWVVSKEAADWLQLIVDAGPDWLLAVTCLQTQVAKNGSVRGIGMVYRSSTSNSWATERSRSISSWDPWKLGGLSVVLGVKSALWQSKRRDEMLREEKEMLKKNEARRWECWDEGIEDARSR